MIVAMNFFKLVVRDVEASERFYRTLGLKVVSRNVGGEEEVRQAQCWLSATGDASACTLILSRFLELPPPPRPVRLGLEGVTARRADSLYVGKRSKDWLKFKPAGAGKPRVFGYGLQAIPTCRYRANKPMLPSGSGSLKLF